MSQNSGIRMRENAQTFKDLILTKDLEGCAKSRLHSEKI